MNRIRKRPATPRALAIAIADYLFVNAIGEQADRLVLVNAAGKDLGGWGKSALISSVIRILEDGLMIGKPTPSKVQNDARG